jgi:hypothetical protein
MQPCDRALNRRSGPLALALGRGGVRQLTLPCFRGARPSLRAMVPRLARRLAAWPIGRTKSTVRTERTVDHEGGKSANEPSHGFLANGRKCPPDQTRHQAYGQRVIDLRVLGDWHVIVPSGRKTSATPELAWQGMATVLTRAREAAPRIANRPGARFCAQTFFGEKSLPLNGQTPAPDLRAA